MTNQVAAIARSDRRLLSQDSLTNLRSQVEAVIRVAQQIKQLLLDHRFDHLTEF